MSEEKKPKEKDLSESAIDIKGQKYVMVKDRVVYFNTLYPNGKIVTSLLSELDASRVYMKAVATPDVKNPDRYFTGYSQEVEGEGMVNKTSAVENAETSAVGRALAMMGIGVLESFASADEVNKAQNAPKYATEPQMKMLYDIAKRQGAKTKEDATHLIEAVAQKEVSDIRLYDVTKVKEKLELLTEDKLMDTIAEAQKEEE